MGVSSTLSFLARFLSEDRTEDDDELLLLSLSLLLSLLEGLRLLRCRFRRLRELLLSLERSLRLLLRLLRRRRLSSEDEEEELLLADEEDEEEELSESDDESDLTGAALTGGGLGLREYNNLS
jgi:hypothetical protein